MAEIDAKVNMSLDDIIKMEKKDKKKKAISGKGKPGVAGGKGGVKRLRGGKGARGGLRGNQAVAGKAALPNATGSKKIRRFQREQPNVVRAGFVTKRYNKNKRNNNGRGGTALVRSRSNTSLNHLNNNNNAVGNTNARGAFLTARRGNAGKFGLTRSRSRTNLISPTMKRFFTNNKGVLKRTNSLPNLRDPTSVHNRLGYQSPAQVAYRNRVKKAKQLLLQRQHQRMQPINDYRVPHNGKSMPSLPQHTMVEHRQPLAAPPRTYPNVGLRSDQILRAQRRAQYAQKLLRMNALRMNPNPNVNFMCTLADEYTTGLRPRSLSMAHTQNRGGLTNARQLARARSPYRQTPQNLAPISRAPLFARQQRTRSRSRSRSRSRHVPIVQYDVSVDDRTFSEMMYSLTGNLGVTERTLNDRFSY